MALKGTEREMERLAELRHYEILDTPPDGAFDRVTELAAAHFRVPVAIISLVDEDRIWFKSHHGLNVNQIDRAPGLCASAILSDELYLVKDAIRDPRTLTNPLVTGELGLRFYAAAPLVTQSGHRLGTVNIIDFTPREIDDDGRRFLQNLASIVMDQMELRLSAREMVASLSRLWKMQVNPTAAMVTMCAWTKKIRIDETWMTFDEFLTKKLGILVSHGMHPDLVKDMLGRTASDETR
jgi:GAF domain-containing protein